MAIIAPPARVFVTGATGYIGGRLVPRLLERGYRVRALARDPRKLDERWWRDDANLEVVQGDVDDTEVLVRHLDGCQAAYYLVHSMKSSKRWIDHDRRLAESFRDAVNRSSLRQVIYLGGLGEMGDDLSDHLRSRREVERILGEATTPLTTLRAAMIIGSGSASFEILRYLVERLPIMITPRWVKTESQPVAVRDVLHWLMATIETDATTGRTIEMGGPDVVPYRELMQITAEELGLRRRIIIPLPVLTPELSSRWIGLVTPVTAEYGRPLAEGLRNRVVITGTPATEVMPHEPLGAREAIRLAVQRTATLEVETRWSSAGVVPGDPDWAGGTLFVDQRDIEIDAPPSAVFGAVCRIGGGHGWYAADILWRIRGWMDELVGGPGLQRGRRHPDEVAFGETLDFWRVADVQRNRRLALRAEMRLPGEATLTFEITPCPDASDAAPRSHLVMTARFQPSGLLGLAYWYSVLPAHHIVFKGMLRGIRRAAMLLAKEERTASAGAPASIREA
jgi:uncharacterized protein YbjT (DUF2867 family)